MTSSYNGWTASKDPKAIGVVPLTVGSVSFPGGCRKGDVATVLGYVAAQFDARVEKLRQAQGCWGFAYRKNRNANNLSCHSSGTALDLNATKHPNGQFPTFTAKQVAAMREILAEVDHLIRWGYDFHGTKDPMHVEVNATAAQLAPLARKLRAHTARVAKPTNPKPANAPVAKAPADPRLHQGTQGQRVLGVQRALIRLGYKPEPKEVARGFWGPGTDRAYRRFQQDGGRNPDGITWAADWRALRAKRAA